MRGGRLAVAASPTAVGPAQSACYNLHYSRALSWLWSTYIIMRASASHVVATTPASPLLQCNEQATVPITIAAEPRLQAEPDYWRAVGPPPGVPSEGTSQADSNDWRGPPSGVPSATPEGAASNWLLERSPYFPPLLVCPPCVLVLCLLLLSTCLGLSCWFRQWLTQNFFPSFRDEPDQLCVEILFAASIPLVSVAFTYVHIWLALFLTFFPTNFLGCCQLPWSNIGLPGWQGIVPWKRRRFSRRIFELMTENVVSIDELLKRLQPEPLAAAIAGPLNSIAADALDAAAGGLAPRLWARVPESRKTQLQARVQAVVPDVIAGVLDDLRADAAAGTGFNAAHLVDRTFDATPELLSLLFINCGWQELVFIRNFGATMGGALGVVQMCIWFAYRGVWLLPVFGLVAGAATNWIALWMIFRPLHPIALCPPWRWCAPPPPEPIKGCARTRGCCVLHGLFLARQPVVAAFYARAIATIILTPTKLLDELCADAERLGASCRARTRQVAEAHLRGGAGDAGSVSDGSMRKLVLGALEAVGSGSLVQTDADGGALDAAIDRACDVVCKGLPGAIHQAEPYAADALQIEETIRERMAVLPPEQFEPLFHAVFAEDEWKLFLVGGALGAAIGTAQQLLITALGLS